MDGSEQFRMTSLNIGDKVIIVHKSDTPVEAIVERRSVYTVWARDEAGILRPLTRGRENVVKETSSIRNGFRVTGWIVFWRGEATGTLFPTKKLAIDSLRYRYAQLG